ncbi:MAG TPA: HAD hydrolase family protein [Burkholderiaceae bacterium]
MSGVAGKRSADALARAARVRLLALDVDGTMTDGTIFIGPGQEAMKGFSVRDGFGLALLREAGLKIAVVTARQSSIVATRAAELRFDAIEQGVADKALALAEIASRYGLEPAQAAFMGDDWPDLGAMSIAGLAAAPADAAPEVAAAAHWVSSVAAGRGAVREFAQWLLQARGEFDALLARHRAPAPGRAR